MLDTHCHLADEAFAADLPEVVARARAAGLARAVCILSAGDAVESAAAVRVRELWPEVSFSVGVHPHHAGNFAGRADDAARVVEAGVAAEGAVAIGEIGLDYYYDFSPREAQHEVFTAQVVLARTLDKPVIIHSREATDDTFQILREAGDGRVRGVFHCFTGDLAMARRVLDLGFLISLAGIVTFPKATTLKEVAAFVPADRLLVETDSPYLAPVPYRGKRNEPAFVVRVAEEVAALRGVTAEALTEQVGRNLDALLQPTLSGKKA